MPARTDNSKDRHSELILVDSDDKVLGHLDKLSCHRGEGVLHRAFSIFLFDAAGRVLIQRRSAHKELWPGYWSNAVCSHPRRGETVEEAAARRVPEELGIRCDLRPLYRFEYQVRYENSGAEHELCWVFAGLVNGGQQAQIHPDPQEVEAIAWADWEDLDQATSRRAEGFTPWARMEWERLRSDQREGLEQALAELAAGSPLRGQPR